MEGRRPRREGGEEKKGTRVRDEKVHGGTAHEKGNAGENSLILMMDDRWASLAASLLFIYREAIVEGKGKHRGENENTEGPEQSVASCARVARHRRLKISRFAERVGQRSGRIGDVAVGWRWRRASGNRD